MAARKMIFAFWLICLVCSGSRAQQSVPPPPKPADDGPSLEVTMKFIQDKLNDIGPLKYSVAWRAAEAERGSAFDETDEITNVVADPQGCTLSYRLKELAGPVRFEADSRDFDREGDRGAHTRVVAYAQASIGSFPSQGSPPGGTRTTNATFVVNLKEVKKITVRSTEQDLNDASAGKTNWTIRPAIFDIVVQTHLAGYRRQLPAGPGSSGPAAAADAILGAILGGNGSQIAGSARAPQGAAPDLGHREGGVFSVDDEELAKRLARAINHAVELCTPDKKPEPF